MDHQPGFLKLVESIRGNVREISAEEAAARFASGTSAARLIDVREDNEYAAGHARGAEHIGKGVIERDIELKVPDPEAELLLYCGGGYRSALATDTLQKMGYRNVYSVAGGWTAWQEAKLPTEGGTGGV